MLRIMIVDDMDIVRRELKRLKLWGERTGFVICEEANNGCEALKRLEDNPVDMVITDIKMPKIDGIELLKEITEKKLCPCVVLLSDHSEFNYARQGMVLGAFDYMVKPVDEEELEKLLQRAKKFILETKDEQLRIKQLQQKLEENLELFYPNSEVNQLIDALKARDAKAIEVANHIADVICLSHNNDLLRVESLLNNIADDIISKMKEEYKFLNKFIDPFNNELQSTNVEDHPYRPKAAFITKIEKIMDLYERFKCGTKENETVAKVCRFILENIEENISLQAVSDALFINKSYLSESFKEKAGISFIEYLTMVKVERAKKLISDDRLKGYEIAELLGYKDNEYFSKLFKKYAGCSPSEFRQITARKN